MELTVLIWMPLPTDRGLLSHPSLPTTCSSSLPICPGIAQPQPQHCLTYSMLCDVTNQTLPSLYYVQSKRVYIYYDTNGQAWHQTPSVYSVLLGTYPYPSITPTLYDTNEGRGYEGSSPSYPPVSDLCTVSGYLYGAYPMPTLYPTLPYTLPYTLAYPPTYLPMPCPTPPALATPCPHPYPHRADPCHHHTTTRADPLRYCGYSGTQTQRGQ